MQRLEDGRIVFSATDLVGFLECEHLTVLERAALEGAVERPSREDPELAVLQERGLEHEQRFLAYLRELGHEIVDGRIAADAGGDATHQERIERDAARTQSLMHTGADVIYQATLFDGVWLGYVDFLVRVDGESLLGAHHYEVVDTKLARRTKGGALLQMCVYSELVAGVQGRMPERMHVALGGSGHRIDSHRLSDYLAYFRSVKSRFLAHVASDGQPQFPLAVVPPPVAHCGVCRWDAYCAALRVEADHLSQVAGMRSDQVKRMEAAGIDTLTQLALLVDPPPAVDGISVAAMAGLREQASLQHRSRGRDAPFFEFLPPQANLGLQSLPLPSPGDLFFDIEGDPFAEEDGLEYLFGVWDPAHRDAHNEPLFRTWWAHNRAEEKVAFEQFVDFVMDRWRHRPGIHVYHYAAYERARMGMLSTRHATREREVDSMLRGGLFVDLYKVVRQGLRIGTPSYSIKKLEPLYGLGREVALRDAGSSIVRYEEYIRSSSTGTANSAILDEIAAYNRDDCRSNAELRDWLEARRSDLEERAGHPIERPSPTDELEQELSERDRRIAELAASLLERVPLVPEQRLADPDLQARWLLGNLLEWHRREEKVDWWAFFDRCSKSDAQLVEDEEAIGQLIWVGEVDRPKQSVRHRYRFDPEQSYRLKAGDEVADPATQMSAGKVMALDALHGTLDLQWGLRHPRPHPTSLIPSQPINAKAQKDALERIGEWVRDNGVEGPGPYRAARDFLLRRPPRAGQADGTDLVPPGTPVEGTALRLVRQLDDTVLPVQGPPGAGKTYLGAEMILELVRAGRQVAITAFTHRALTNLLDTVLDHAQRQGLPVRAVRKIENDETVQMSWRYEAVETNEEVIRLVRNRDVDVAAGTAWLWARTELESAVDTIFVDEAGQMSLANVVAVSRAARNVVLLGDPQQLSQVKKGAHPDGVDVSSLEFVLDGGAVIDPRRGLFLPQTHRLHPDVNAFTSQAFYEGKLAPAPETARQSLHAAGDLTGTGVRWRGVVHRWNRNSSDEEALPSRSAQLQFSFWRRTTHRSSSWPSGWRRLPLGLLTCPGPREWAPSTSSRARRRRSSSTHWRARRRTSSLGQWSSSIRSTASTSRPRAGGAWR
ncbi:MAG: TM0106 family RecB-like putative nuclease [Chloroflexi bacterium]|nr:MAG: TM0106 family RecB-like putative nuclease [Chloroflexota bacterium]